MFLQEPKTQLSTSRLALVMGVGTGAGSHWCTSSSRGDPTAEQSSKEEGENVEFAEDVFCNNLGISTTELCEAYICISLIKAFFTCIV